MNAAVAQLERIAAEVPSVKVVPNPAQPAPQPDRPYVITLQLDFNNTGAVDVAKQLRHKVGINGDQPGEIENGKVRLYVIGQGALGAAAQTSHQARHRPGRAVEPSDRPDRVARGVRLAGRRRDAAGAGHLHGRGDHGTGLSAVDVHHDVGVRHVDGVDVRHRAGHRLFTIHLDAVPRGTARRPRSRAGRRRRDGHLRAGGGAVRPDRDRVGDGHLPDQHPGAGVDGHRRDPRRRGGGADLDDADPRGAGDVRPGRGQTVLATCTGRAGRRPPSRGSGPGGRAG